MAHRLDGHRDEILALKAQNWSVRKIAEKIGEPPSTVQHAIKTWTAGEVRITQEDLDGAMQQLTGMVEAVEAERKTMPHLTVNSDYWADGEPGMVDLAPEPVQLQRLSIKLTAVEKFCRNIYGVAWVTFVVLFLVGWIGLLAAFRHRISYLWVFIAGAVFMYVLQKVSPPLDDLTDRLLEPVVDAWQAAKKWLRGRR